MRRDRKAERIQALLAERDHLRDASERVEDRLLEEVPDGAKPVEWTKSGVKFSVSRKDGTFRVDFWSL